MGLEETIEIMEFFGVLIGSGYAAMYSLGVMLNYIHGESSKLYKEKHPEAGPIRNYLGRLYISLNPQNWPDKGRNLYPF